MSFDLTGQLHFKYETEQVTATFKKREFVVRYADNPTYPQFIKLQLVQDKAAELDKFQNGDMLTVSFDLQGREWTDPKTAEKRYFTTLNAWRLEVPATAVPVAPVPEPFDAAAFGSDDDLPF